MSLRYVILDIIKSYVSWKKNQKCLDSTSRMGLEDLAKSRRFFPGNTLYWMSVNSLYLWKEQEFKIVEEVWPNLKMKNIGGHTSATILNSCSFQRYRLLTPIQYKVLPGKNLLLFAKSSKPMREVESRHFWLFFQPKLLFIMSIMTYVRPILILHNLS